MSETVTKKLMLFFPNCECEKPIIYNLVKDYNLMVNVFRAKVTPEEEGYLVLDVTGTQEDIDKALDFVRTFDVTVSYTKCTHCGHCITHCPPNALRIGNAAVRDVVYDEAECIECLACIRVCPYAACSSTF